MDSIETQNFANKPAVFQLKGSLFTLTALHLLEFDLPVLKHQLAAMLQQAPKFFQDAPVVIDLQKLNAADNSLDFASLLTCLREAHLIPVGIRHATAAQREAAMALGLASLPDARAEPMAKTISKPASSESTLLAGATSTPAEASSGRQPPRVITQPVRSGQRIYAKDADLIVLATISPGAEILADGHIHIYGRLRGRALAGVTGNSEARIFCQALEPELIAIAGNYWLHEDLKAIDKQQAVQIYLEDERLKFAYLN